MKPISLLLFLVLIQITCTGQLLKIINQSAKNAVNVKVATTTDKVISDAIDSVVKKSTVKKKQTKHSGDNSPSLDSSKKSNKQVENEIENASIDANKDQPDDGEEQGFIEMQLSSTTVFLGGILTITGESGFHEKRSTIDLILTGPGVNATFVVALDKEGKFGSQWYAKGDPGNYKWTAISSDKKTSKTIDFSLEALDELDEMASDNIAVVNKVVEAIEKQVANVKKELSSKHNAELESKMVKLRGNAGQLNAIFGKLNAAGKLISGAAKNGEVLPKNVAGNLSQLRDALHEHKESTQKLLDNVDHNTYGYTACETFEMVNEACAAFSTVTNFTGKLKSIAKNLALDKFVPTATTALNEFAFNKKLPNEAVVPAVKIITSASADAEGLMTGTGPMGVAGDVSQLIFNVLMKQYCGSFEGSVQQTYKVAHRNKAGTIWWSYGYNTQAVLTLRYPKSNGNNRVVKMKGHIEGNATKFDFYQNMAVEDEYDKISKGRAPLLQLRVLGPVALPFSSSAEDKAGFGMMARAVATPSYFNLPVDATYDRDAGTIRLFLTDGGIDFSPLVNNRVLFLMPLVAPIFKVQKFDIDKAKPTINAVIKRYGEYKVIENKGNLSFSGRGIHHVGNTSSDFEINVEVMVEAKQ